MERSRRNGSAFQVRRLWWVAAVLSVALFLDYTTTTTTTTRYSYSYSYSAEAFTATKTEARPRGDSSSTRITLLRTTANDETNNNNNNHDDDEFVPGGSMDDLFPQKMRENTLRNLFGIGRKDDADEADGSYQPPRDSMTGRIVVITGGSSGLGLESAKRLALAGATVVLTARTPGGVLRSVNAVRDYCRGKRLLLSGRSTGAPYTNANPIVRGATLDLDDFSSVRSFPGRYRDCVLPLSKITDRDQQTRTKRNALRASSADQNDGEKKKIHAAPATRKIDVLMNNAGGGGFPARELTVDGFERTFQSCHLGHFLLTARLFEEGLLNDNTNEGDEGKGRRGATGCTVINVASVAHLSAEATHARDDDGDENGSNETNGGSNDVDFGFDFDNMNSEISYSGEAYCQGKLANILFTRELQKRATDHNATWLKAVSLEPGGVATDVWRHTSLGYDPWTFRERREKHEEPIEQPEGRTLLDKIRSVLFYRFLSLRVERGANTQVWLAHASGTVVADSAGGGSGRCPPIVRGGKHYDEYRSRSPVLEYARNQDHASRLWEASEEMAGIRFDLSGVSSPVPDGSICEQQPQQQP